MLNYKYITIELFWLILTLNHELWSRWLNCPQSMGKKDQSTTKCYGLFEIFPRVTISKSN